MPRHVPSFVALTAGLWLVVICFARLRAGTIGLPFLNSDSAIPVLMANARRWDPFQLFYYGQDRFGAWPLLAIRLGGMAFGAVITWERLHTCLMAWVFSGALVLAALCRPRALGALVFMVVLLANPEMVIMFDVGQPYGWQLTSILLAWWSFRCLLESFVKANRPAEVAVTSRLLCAAGWAALATWVSPVSGPILLLIQSIELVRVTRLSKNWPRYLGLIAAGPIAIGVGFEVLLRKLYHHFANSHFGNDFHTSMKVDWENLNNNARRVLRAVLESNWSIAAISGALIAIVAAGLIIRMVEVRFGRQSTETATELSFVALGCASAALVQIAIIIAGEHFRMNQFDGRFLALVRFFGEAAGLLSIAATLSIIMRRFNLWSVSSRLGSGFGLAVLAGTIPIRSVDPRYTAQKRIAAEMVAHSTKNPLLSGYWDAYELAALAPRSLVPVPFEGEYLRIPWNVVALREATEIIVGHQGVGDDEHKAPALGTPILVQYGITMRLVIPDWYVDGTRHYSLYRNETPSAQSSGGAR